MEVFGNLVEELAAESFSKALARACRSAAEDEAHASFLLVSCCWNDELHINDTAMCGIYCATGGSSGLEAV